MARSCPGQRHIWITSDSASPDVPFLLYLQHILGAYSVIIVVGFLFFALELNCGPLDENRRVQLDVRMALFVIFWATGFLTILMDRPVECFGTFASLLLTPCPVPFRPQACT